MDLEGVFVIHSELRVGEFRGPAGEVLAVEKRDPFFSEGFLFLAVVVGVEEGKGSEECESGSLDHMGNDRGDLKRGNLEVRVLEEILWEVGL